METILSLDTGRLIFTIFVFIFYFAVLKKKKEWLLYSSLFLLAILPFNITLQLSEFFPGYITGIVSNYTIPTIHILDIFVFFNLIFLFKERKIKFSKNEKLFFTALLFLFATKAIFDLNILSTLTIFRTFFYILTIYFTSNYLWGEKIKEKVSYILLGSVCIQFLIGFLQFLYGKSLGLVFLGESQVVKGMFGASFIELNEKLFLRAYGTFPHPNVLAGYLFFILAYSLFFLGQKVERKKKEDGKKLNILSLSISILSTILVFLTFSRIVMILAVGLWLIFFYTKIRHSTCLYTPIFFSRFLDFENSFSDRVELVKNSFAIIQNNLLVGIGAGRYVYGIDHYPIYTAGGFLLLEPVHNIYLLILAEYGVIFGIPLIVTIAYLLAYIFLRGNFVVKYMVLGIFAISMLDHYFITLPQGLVMFLCGMFFLKNFLGKKT